MSKRDNSDYFSVMLPFEIQLNEEIWAVAGGMYRRAAAIADEQDSEATLSEAQTDKDEGDQ